MQLTTSRRPTIGEAATVRIPSSIYGADRFRRFITARSDEALDLTLARLREEARTPTDLVTLNTQAGRLLEPLNYTYIHSRQVGFLAYIAASVLDTHDQIVRFHAQTDLSNIDRPLDLAKPLQSVALTAGNLHDIGKVWVPYGLLAKELGYTVLLFIKGTTNSLTDVELKVLRDRHIELGARFLSGVQFEDNEVVKSMILCHHVTYDGLKHGRYTSYPDGLPGKARPMYERILKVCDVVSACLPRFYRTENKIQTLEDAMALAVAVSGTQLDQTVVSALLSGLYGIQFSTSRQFVDECISTAKTKLSQMEVQPEDPIQFVIDNIVKTHSLYKRSISRSRRNLSMSRYQGELSILGVKSRDTEHAASCATAFSEIPTTFP